MKVAIRSFPIRYEGQDDEIVAGCSRVADDHPLVAEHPDAWRDFTVDDELRIRSERIAEIDTTRVTSYTPQSEAGKREQREAQFWDGVTRHLERTAPDRETSAERAEQSVFDEGLRLIEDSDSRDLADFNDQAVREFGFDRGGWARRSAD